VIGPVRYRFGAFVISPRQRTLARDGRVVALIPKYFDVLLVLVRRRHEAVSKAELFGAVWRDVVVSDGALSQAVRTLRRVLDDGAREPRFIRTVSRHGYQFVFPDVVEEADEPTPTSTPTDLPPGPAVGAIGDEAIERLVDRLIASAADGPGRDEDARELAAQLHQLGTANALARLTARPRHARALAIMRDERWGVTTAGDVPLLADREAGAAIWQTLVLRLGAARGALVRRWAVAVATGGAGGAVAGLAGGLLLVLLPSRATANAPVALGAIGWLAGTAGAASLAGGLALAEAAARSRRTPALVAAGAVSGVASAAVAHVVARALLEGLFGAIGMAIPGPIDGLVIGASAGLGYAWATRLTPGGSLAAPVGRRRFAVALTVGAACAAGATALALAGRPLVGGLVHEIARASASPQLVLAPLGRIVGEPEFGAATRATLAALEGLALGLSMTWGLTSRPRRPQ
jgi:DNA-binding winged helix-turn-helix (wHTH) protein